MALGENNVPDYERTRKSRAPKQRDFNVEVFYDKNGNRIWDNDIVNTNSNLRAQIKFGLYSNSFSTRKYNQGFYMDFMDNEYYRHELGYWAGKSVVIGNIFDNPELLQEEER